MEKEVLVVGAGPTGLTTAIELVRRGVKTAVIEQRSGLSSLPRVVGITPASMELLSACGATKQLLHRGVKLEGLRVLARESTALSVDFAQSRNNTAFKYLLSVSQERIESVLTSTLGKMGVYVKYNTRLRSLNDTRDSVLTVCSDGTTKSYQYVVGADGFSSTIRENMGLAFTGQDLPQRWSVADAHMADWQHMNKISLFMQDAGSFAAMIPAPDARIRIMANSNSAIDQLVGQLKTTDLLWQDEFDVSVRQVKTYQRGNVFLAGDAAHCHSPSIGSGINLGIADAAFLADCIATDKVTNYSAGRHPAGSRAIANSEHARKLLTTSHPLGRKALESSLRLTNRSSILQRKVIDQLLYG